MRKLFEAFIVALGLFVTGAASAEEALELYQARAVVTGTREETRAVGFAVAFEEVLAKVSGDARLIGDGRVAALADECGRVRRFLCVSRPHGGDTGP